MIFVTGNENKVKEVESMLNIKIKHQAIDLPEIQALDVEDVVKDKAIRAFDIIKKPVLIEDTGIVIISWNGLPGACTKWFMKSVGSDGIVKMLGENRKAKAITIFDYYDGIDHIICEGVIYGKISKIPVGDNGFGWDNVFIPNNYDKTFAQMSQEEKNTVSMRRIAIENLKSKIIISN